MLRAIMAVFIHIIRTQTDGFILGLLVAWVFGATANWLRKMRGKAQAPYKPMEIRLTTPNTPAQVVNEASGAQWLVRLFWFAVIAVLAYLVWDAFG